MQGKRLYNMDGFKPGDYGLLGGIWSACTPNGHLGNLKNHEVTEHEDGTITVSPSILVGDDKGDHWHGYLEHGIWREV